MRWTRQWWPTALLAALLIGPALVAGRSGVGNRVQTAITKRPVSSFIMSIGNGSGTTAVGEASFRRGPGNTHFSLELGRGNQEGAVVFATEGAGPEAPGRYLVNDEPMSGSIHALVITGSATAPTGVYRAQSGTLTVRAVGDNELEGSFELDALGFRADDPEQDQQSISVTGSFLATDQPMGAGN